MNTINIEALKRELLELDAAFLNAVLKNDVTVIERNLPDDFLSVFPNGRVANKAAEIENVRTVELESYSTDEVQVHWYGDNVAIINFRLSLKMKDQDIKQVRDSHVYMKRSGRWQMIMGQTTPILHQ
ncbi:hypothetical protein NIES4071_34930 [Calothrix sp. NIES-4071]|nr:hypothetical protein NIES4071_34930 [Calothrix sp. NIES-4071]BAZ57812.1 hypothetical protein NIES4105_34860 [Calothrix sp. NIES-4105]